MTYLDGVSGLDYFDVRTLGGQLTFLCGLAKTWILICATDWQQSLVYACFIPPAHLTPAILHLNSSSQRPEVKVWMIQYKAVFSTREATHMFFSLQRGRDFHHSLTPLFPPLLFPSASVVTLFIPAFSKYGVWGPSDSDSLREGPRNLHEGAHGLIALERLG